VGVCTVVHLNKAAEVLPVSQFARFRPLWLAFADACTDTREAFIRRSLSQYVRFVIFTFVSAEVAALHSTSQNSQRIHSEATGIQETNILWRVYILRVCENNQHEFGSGAPNG
jgi:hypothetical protein